MLEDIVLNPEPSYGAMVLSWAMTSISAKLVGVVVGYIKAKTPVQKTLMDFITIFSLRLILGACLASSVLVSTMTLLSDSGHTTASLLAWLMFFFGSNCKTDSNINCSSTITLHSAPLAIGEFCL